MHRQSSNNRPRHGVALGFVMFLALAIVVAGCGGGASTGAGSGAAARTLLRQTFSGSHRTTSGRIQLTVTVTPTGSRTLTRPITVSFGGPFELRPGTKVPASDFTVGLDTAGQNTSLSIISTGHAGYVSTGGVNYLLPQKQFESLEGGFSSVANPSSTSSSGVLSRLGIDPLDWLSRPQIGGRGVIGGTPSTEVTSGVDVPALLTDLSTILGHANTSAVAGVPRSLSSSTQTKIAAELRDPSFQVWSGDGDHTVRRLRLAATLPVRGTASTLLGGLSAAAIVIELDYSDLGQPQTISAPTSSRPFSEFSSHLAAIVQAVEAQLETPVAGSSTSGSGTSTAASPYDKCIAQAGNDVNKIASCGSLLPTG